MLSWYLQYNSKKSPLALSHPHPENQYFSLPFLSKATKFIPILRRRAGWNFAENWSNPLTLPMRKQPREMIHLVNDLGRHFFHEITGFLLAEGKLQIQSRGLALALFWWFSWCQHGPVPSKLYSKQVIFYIIFQEVLCSITELRMGWTKILLQFWESHLTS